MAGFRPSEQKNMKLYQRVRCLVPKCHLVVDAPYESSSKGKRKAAPEVPDVVATVVTASTGQGSLADKLSQEDSKFSSITGDSSRRVKPVPVMVRRRTSKEVQRAHAKSIMQAKREKQALKQITIVIERSKQLPSGHPAKHTIKEIVDATNQQQKTNVSCVTASRYVLAGLIGAHVSPLKRGNQGTIHPMIYNALKGALASFLKLEQATAKKQSTI
jgi:hypothetical protein